MSYRSSPLTLWFRRLVALGLVCLLSACSSTTLLYNRLDFVLPWYLERYVDLDRDQARQFDEQLEPLLAWHRRDELPRYLEFLDELLITIESPLTIELVQDLTLTLEDAWYRIRDRGLDELLVLGDSLRDEQIDEFMANLEKKQRKYEDKYLARDEEEFREDAYDNLRELIEDYLGRLNASQRQRVREAAQTLRRSDDRWLMERADWLNAIDRELRREPGWEARVREMITGWESRLDADVTALYDHNARTVQEALIAVVNDRTAKQDRRLRRKISGLRDDVKVLIRQAD